MRNVEGMRNLLETLCQRTDVHDVNAGRYRDDDGLDLDSVTVEEFVLRHTTFSAHAMDNVRISTRALLGLEPREMSMLYLLRYCKSAGGLLRMRRDDEHGGQYLRLVQGKSPLRRFFVEHVR